MIRIMRILETDTEMCYYTSVHEYKYYGARERGKKERNITALILESGSYLPLPQSKYPLKW